MSLFSNWNVSRALGTAADHHGRDVVRWERSAVLLEHLDRAVVIGSTQELSDIDEAAARASGISVVRRRSGGGAVFLDPQSAIWIDVVIPRDDELWTDDVSSSMLWLGTAWVAALSTFGIDDLVVHSGAMLKTSLSRTICFDGLAPGEITRAGCKLVGISQRRTRDGARFQCVVYRSWDPTIWRHCLASSEVRDGLDRLGVETVGASGEEILSALGGALAALSAR